MGLQYQYRQNDWSKADRHDSYKKGKKKCLKIDTVIPGAQNIFHKEQKKVDPSVEVHKMWNVKGTIIFVIINTLGTVSNSLGKLLDEIGITKDISSPEDLIAWKDPALLHERSKMNYNIDNNINIKTNNNWKLIIPWLYNIDHGFLQPNVSYIEFVVSMNQQWLMVCFDRLDV